MFQHSNPNGDMTNQKFTLICSLKLSLCICPPKSSLNLLHLHLYSPFSRGTTMSHTPHGSNLHLANPSWTFWDLDFQSSVPGPKWKHWCLCTCCASSLVADPRLALASLMTASLYFLGGVWGGWLTYCNVILGANPQVFLFQSYTLSL